MEFDNSCETIPSELLNHIENIVNENIALNNIVIIGRRNVGKTSVLKYLTLKFIEKNSVIIFDSATQHAEKSLIKKLEQINKESYLITSVEYQKLFLALNKEIAAENQFKFIFCDMSFFLELSYKQISPSEKIFYQEIYEHLTEKFLMILNELRTSFFVLFDEIEFDEKVLRQVQLLNERGIFIVSAIHDKSAIHDLSCAKIINLDRVRLGLNLNLPKESKILCGNCCVEIAASIFFDKHCRISTPLIWCTDLAIELERVGISTKVFCHNSRLYEDFKLNSIDSFKGFSSIGKYLNCGRVIIDCPIESNTLIAELSENFCGIYCVDSRTFNEDESLSGGHFVLAYLDKNNKITLLNPKRTVITTIQDYSLKKLQKACELNGSWRILLGNVIS